MGPYDGPQKPPSPPINDFTCFAHVSDSNSLHCQKFVNYPSDGSTNFPSRSHLLLMGCEFPVTDFVLNIISVSSFSSLTMNVCDKPGCKSELCNHRCLVRFSCTRYNKFNAMFTCNVKATFTHSICICVFKNGVNGNKW